MLISSERFAVVDTPVDNFETEGLMDPLGIEIVYPGVGSHFAAAVVASPAFGFSQESSAELLATMSGRNIPAFNVTDGARGIAAIGMRPHRHFDKAREFAVVKRQQNYGGEIPERLARQNRSEFFGVLLQGGVGP